MIIIPSNFSGLITGVPPQGGCTRIDPRKVSQVTLKTNIPVEYHIPYKNEIFMDNVTQIKVRMKTGEEYNVYLKERQDIDALLQALRDGKATFLSDGGLQQEGVQGFRLEDVRVKKNNYAFPREMRYNDSSYEVFKYMFEKVPLSTVGSKGVSFFWRGHQLYYSEIINEYKRDLTNVTPTMTSTTFEEILMCMYGDKLKQALVLARPEVRCAIL